MYSNNDESSWIGDSEFIEAKFYGRNDNIVVSFNGCLLFYLNKGYEREYIETQTSWF